MTNWYGEFRSMVEDEARGTTRTAEIVFCLAMFDVDRRAAALRLIRARLGHLDFHPSSISREDWCAWWAEAADALSDIFAAQAPATHARALRENSAEIIAACAWANHENQGRVGPVAFGSSASPPRSVLAHLWLLDLEVCFDIAHPDAPETSSRGMFWSWPNPVARGFVKVLLTRRVDGLPETTWFGLPTRWSYRKAGDETPIEQLLLW